MANVKSDNVRINIMFPRDLLAKVDERANALNISRSAFVMTALSDKLKADEMLLNLPQMLDTFNKAIEESKRINK